MIPKTKADLIKDLNEAKATLSRLEAEIASINDDDNWPNGQSKVWRIDSWDTVFEINWHGCANQRFMLERNDIFKTKVDAEDELNYRLAERKVLKALRNFRGDWKPDWKLYGHSHYTIVFDHSANRFRITNENHIQTASHKWYSSKEACQWVIDNCLAELNTIWGIPNK